MRAAALLLVAACTGAPTLDEAACPPGGTDLTYASFGEPFLAGWCQTCHASTATDRHGAPVHVTFDSLDEVRERADRVFVRAADVNTSMPPGPDDPPQEERALLAEWLACGAP